VPGPKVQCGACGARFGGDPCHGKFYYRCIKRCKRTPSISEHILNQTVKEAVRNVLVNPAVILDPLRKIREAEAREIVQGEDATQHAERESKRVDGEEQRILEAYRTGAA
jgi:recombinase-like zinc beta ribbon protein